MVAQRDIPIPHPVAVTATVTDVIPVSGLRVPGSRFDLRVPAPVSGLRMRSRYPISGFRIRIRDPGSKLQALVAYTTDVPLFLLGMGSGNENIIIIVRFFYALA